MSQFQTREERGIYVHVMPTKKYKVNAIVATLTQDLREETATGLALLPYVLMRGSEQYPTPEKLQLALDELYGASLHGVIDKKGERQIVDFTMTVPNHKYLATEEDLFQKALGILADVMLRPIAAGGAFESKNVEAEKKQHKKRLEAMIDDKASYALQRCLEEMTKGEPYSIPRLGRLEQIDSVTATDLYTLYQNVLRTAPIHIYVIGDVETDQVAQQIFQTFSFAREPQTELSQVRIHHPARGEAKQIIDRMDVNQGKLNIGLWTNVDYKSDDYPALLVFNGVFGGFPHSKLFVNVREKHSLAYTVASRVDPFKGLMYVISGVEFDKLDKALAIIKEQLEVTRQGQVTEEEMSFTIKGLVNSYKTTMDNPTVVSDIHLNGLITGRIRTPEEMIELVQKVTVDDVVRIAKGIQLDTVYMLRDQEGKANA